MSVLAAFALLAVAERALDNAEDPYRVQGFDCRAEPDGPFQTDESDARGRFRIRADLNFDGTEDLILHEAREGGPCGTAGCVSRVFLRDPNGHYRDVGVLQHYGVRLSPSPYGAGRGWILTTRYRGPTVIHEVGLDLVSLDIDASDEAVAAIWVDGKPEWTWLRPEYAFCKDGMLQWRPSPPPEE